MIQKIVYASEYSKGHWNYSIYTRSKLRAKCDMSRNIFRQFDIFLEVNKCKAVNLNVA